jgi:hypothetical protein
MFLLKAPGLTLCFSRVAKLRRLQRYLFQRDGNKTIFAPIVLSKKSKVADSALSDAAHVCSGPGAVIAAKRGRSNAFRWLAG